MCAEKLSGIALNRAGLVSGVRGRVFFGAVLGVLLLGVTGAVGQAPAAQKDSGPAEQSSPKESSSEKSSTQADDAKAQNDAAQQVAAASALSAALPDAPGVATKSESNVDAASGSGADSAAGVDGGLPPLKSDYAARYRANTVAVTVKGTPRRFLLDQRDIWTSPARIRWHDAVWLVPLGTATGFLIATDQHTETSLIHTNATSRQQASDVANAGLGVLAGIPALMFLGSSFTDAPHGRETALLSAEAAADAIVVSEVLQYSTSRERPLVDNGHGKFFQGSGFSFPSNHATVAWSLASVLAHEYPGWWSQLAVYTGATAVSLARVAGQQHFPSDVLVGSAFGYLIGHYVYRARHDSSRTEEFKSADPRPYGPTEVPTPVPFTPAIARATGQSAGTASAGAGAGTSGTTQGDQDQAAARLQAETQTIQPRAGGSAAGNSAASASAAGTNSETANSKAGSDAAQAGGASAGTVQASVAVGTDAEEMNGAVPVAYRPRPADVDPDERGSVYVPMDSWVYPALDRLAGLGFIPSQSTLIRPWTRQECLRQVDQAESLIAEQLSNRDSSRWELSTAREGARLTGDLRRAFAHENDAFESFKLDSLYSRDTTIAGHALMRSWDFGQTLDNDYGRPYVQGTNVISGASVAAVSGRFSLYVRDEFQHAPGYSTYPQNVLDYIYGPSEGIDPVPLTGAIGDVARSRPLEMYAGVELGGFEFQFGKQEMYWGPTYDAPLSWSVNAEPTYNLQLVATRPHQLPGFLSQYGTWRVDLVMGKLSAHTHPARPWYNSQKITINLGDNFEMGFTRFSVFAGVGSPLTLKNFLRNIFSFTSPMSGVDPGDRKSGFDFRYKLPGLQWITVYTDSYADDEPITLDAPRRSVWMPGIYFSRIPGIPHVDFRFETPSTRMLAGDQGPVFQYINDHYVDANLNKNFFYGNSIGRDGRRYEGWMTYWFSGATNLQFGYRQTQRSPLLLPGAGTQSDALMRSHVQLGEHWSVGVFTQYERYYEPLLGGPQRNITGQFELKWEPKVGIER